MRSDYTLVFVLVTILSFARSTTAQVYDWINPAGGVFGNAANWSAGGPPNQSTETGEFGQSDAYTVTFGGNTNFGAVIVSAGFVNFWMNDWIVQPTNTTASGVGSANGATLRIYQGSFHPGGFTIGGNAGTFGTLGLHAASETIVGAGAFLVGASGNGTLTIEDGATLRTSTTSTIGVNAGGVGTASVTGAGSKWDATTTLRVGQTGNGTLDVLNGGVVNSSALEVGENFNSTGTINVSGPGAVFTNAGTANIGGSSATLPAASATLNIGPGGTLNLNGTTNLRANAKVKVTGGTLGLATLNFAPSSDVEWSSGTIKFANGTAITPAILGLLLENTSTLGPSRTLAANAGTMTVAADLILGGGRLSVSSLTLNANVDVNAFSSIAAASTLTIGPSRTLEIDDFGSAGATTTFTNNGVLKMNGPLATVTSLVTNNLGTVYGTGRFTAGINNGASATIRASANDHLIIQGPGLSNSGNIELLGGTVEYSAMLTNAATGFISGRGVFRGSSATPGGIGLTNDGAMAFSAGHTDIYGDVTNSATGRIIAAGGSVVTFYDDVVNNGDIRTNLGSRSVFFGDVTGAGTFTGTGDVELNGDLRPGNSPANVSFGGDVVISPTGGLEIELAGITKGAGYDSLTIAGAASLSGALDVSLLDGFVPDIGQSFEILTAAGGISGTFDATNFPTLPSGLQLNLTYQPTSVLLSVAGVSGDYNFDAHVDAADYVLWRKGLGGNYNTWRTNFGESSAGNGSAASSNAPEPTSILLALVATTACFALSRFRRAA
jgi:T5SS/PEP-CTERM-associated repeat protein